MGERHGYNFNPFGFDGDGTKFVIVEYNSTPADWGLSRYGTISVDAGETWTRLYDSEALHGATASAESHLHGACYDPWGDVFYIGEGHGSAGGVYYSTNNGATWQGPMNVESDSVAIPNNAPTVIVATDDGLVMGSDNNENGLFGVLRKPDPSDQSIVRTWAMRTGRDGLVTFAQRGWRDPETGFVYVTFRSEYGDTPITLAAGTASSGGLVYEEPTMPVNGGADRFAAVARIDSDTLFLYGEVLGVAKHFKGTLTRPGATSIEVYSDTGQLLRGKVGSASSLAVGRSKVVGLSAVAVGQGASVNGAGSVAVGHASSVTASDGTAIGRTAVAGNAGTALGSGAKSGYASVAIGFATEALGQDTVAIGSRAKVGIEGVTIGRLAEATGEHSIAIGYIAKGTAASVAIGHSAIAGLSGVAIGKLANLTGNNAVAIGREAKATLTSTALGYQANASGTTNSVALGAGTTTTHSNQVAMGSRNVLLGKLDADPAMPASGQGLLYLKDDGAGGTELYVRSISGIKKVATV